MQVTARRTANLGCLLTLFLLLGEFAFAGNDINRVVSVLDGQTIAVLHSNRTERIRLNGIDCPGKGQAHSKGAKHAASALVFGKEVTLETHGLDKYGRTVADVILPDGTNVNHELVKEGWCWWYRKYAPGNVALEELEKEARDAKKGLWADPAPVPPWVYRKARRRQALDPSDLTPRGTPALAAPQKNVSTGPEARLYPIIGNRQGRIYHRPDCPNYSQISPRNRIVFKSASHAEALGYRFSEKCP
jgi:micrococcal nuclease